MISLIDTSAAATGGSQDLIAQVEAIFSPSGLLSHARNFEYRPQQQQMAVAVARALQAQDHLLVEAGTGVGKSLAYLVPAILFAVANKKKAIISTHTINLQEQLIGKDLPMLEQVLPVEFTFTMLKGRSNYLCTRRLHKALQHADGLFNTPEIAELKRIQEWSERTKDGSLSDFEIEPDPKVWQQVCSERGLCAPKLCGGSSEFAEQHNVCFFQRARSRILAADVLVLNHTLFFMHLGGLEEEVKGGVLFKNDFVIFDEAHTMEHVASKHVGLSVSSSQVRYSLHRLWNPRTEKGLLGLLRKGPAIERVRDALDGCDFFFGDVEDRCEELIRNRRAETEGGQGRNRAWTELRIRQPDLAEDALTLPIQRVRESVSEAIKTVEDKDTAQELMECNRRLEELKDGLAVFLGQRAEDYVYWVERSGRVQKNPALCAAPIDVADYLRARLFRTDTSVVLTSATLSVSAGNQAPRGRGSSSHQSGLNYCAKRLGAEDAVKLQVGSPFDYERQMKVFVVSKMPDPREEGYSTLR